MPDLVFAVQAVSETAARTAVRARDFQVTVDEPSALGGTDIGPNPVEFILAGFAGCLNVVAHIVAKEQNIKLDKLQIDVAGSIDPSRLFGQPDSPRAGFQQIEAKLKVESDASPEQLNEWLEAVESRCPVFDNLSTATPVRTQLELPVAA